LKKIAILCFTDFTKEPRVIRTIESLTSHYNIDIYSNGRIFEKVSSIDITMYDNNYKSFNGGSYFSSIVRFFERNILGYKLGSDKYFERLYWDGGRKKLLTIIEEEKYDLVIGHGIFILPILKKLKCPTIFNTHEFYEREFEENENWKKFTQPYYNYLIQTYLKEVDLMFCVCESIQNEYLKKCKIKSLVITNATKYNDLKPTQLGNKIRIIHHGAAIRSRELERMAELVDFLGEEYELTFMLVKTDLNYYNEFFAKYSVNSRIKFTEPVKVNEIPKFCNQYDIGIFILPPVNYNWENALPNKVFEYVQARLALAVSPNVNMRNLVNKYKLGVVAEDYTTKSMASALMKITREQISQYKYSSNQYALKLSAEENYKVMLQSVNQLIN